MEHERDRPYTTHHAAREKLALIERNRQMLHPPWCALDRTSKREQKALNQRAPTSQNFAFHTKVLEYRYRYQC